MLVSLLELKQFLKITDDDSLDVDLMNSLVRAHDEADVYCDRHFELKNHIEYQAGQIRSHLNLKQYPVVSDGTHAFSLWNDIGRTWDNSTKIDPAGYQVDSEMGMVYLDTEVFLQGLRADLLNIKIDYWAGYVPSTMPNSLRLAILKLASAGFSKAETFVNAVTQATENQSKPDDVRKEAFEILDLYRKVR